MKRKILIIGGGAREYALGRKLREDPRVSELFFSPGNGGTQSIGENVLLLDFAQIAAFTKEKMINLVLVGTEEPLVGGWRIFCKKRGWWSLDQASERACSRVLRVLPKS
ncbi:hypothetical protein NHP190012_08670 [Helicobacter sp. NHP19-012]|uniref:Phosphoribosylglycinamide synthetase N-terminal domain-containing protein n=1 Tax=Helicobacter gastrofelis TaxID=2849642 RepID=A0ABM7SEL9_9HELI|nr:phosphoribosylamine--glycine ligase N-terminal domain-containing protein [Helicobacter sp. NHP19-012]BCZ19225.1 hypothetical protein NHP190012_08670 [Helicobacter sp. NHP19-012]